MNKALLLRLLLLAALLSPVPALVLADCSTPQPTATPEPTYAGNVTGTQSGHLIGYWKLNETSGTVAADSSGNSRDGSYSGVTLNATTFVDGSPAPSFDAVNDLVNIYGASLSGAFNKDEGTALVWTKFPSAAWTDGIGYVQLNLRADASNQVQFQKQTNNIMRFRYVAGGTTETITYTTTSTSWIAFVVTWSKSGDHVEGYANGTTITTTTGLGTWTGALSSTTTVVGAFDTSFTNSHLGNIAHVAVWDVALSDSEVVTISTVPSVGATQTPQPTCTPSPTPTYTPTGAPTETMTPTPSLTADIYQFWTLPPPETTGTPEAGRSVAFVWRMEAGQVSIALVLGAIIFSLWAMFVVWYLRRRKGGGAET